jgi:L-ascorbate metabolism protein UlaG (beta-lactamase superfamily)
MRSRSHAPLAHAPDALPGVSRRSLLQQLCAVGGITAAWGTGMVLGSSPALAAPERRKGELLVRWLGGGVVEIATPDYKQIAYCDAWVWNNSGWDRFSIAKPPEYASRDGFVQYVQSKNPEAVFVLLTHDHGDHMGDYLEMLKALSDAGLPVKTSGQSDLMRAGLVEDFKKAGIDPTKVVANNGAGMNFGGVSRHGGMTAYLVPAVHSNVRGHPSAGFMLDIGGVRVYVSGDTDLFGELKVLGERYRPDLAVVCVGDGPFTMGPEDAARACQWLGVSQALPVHYAHNGLVKGVDAGLEFQRALQKIAPKIHATITKPGELQRLRFGG